MPDLADFEALIARLARIDFSQTSEQATRKMAVNPVIGALGQDTFNPAEVAREYPVHGGKVDYCLRGPMGALVLIEVKRTGKELSDHQEQLLDYAFARVRRWRPLPTASSGGSTSQRLKGAGSSGASTLSILASRALLKRLRPCIVSSAAKA